MKQLSSTPLTDHLAVLGEPVRLRILRLAEREELSVGEMAKVLQLPQSTVSRHLKVLLDTAWVTKRNEGTATLHRLVLDDLPETCRGLWLAVRERLACDRLASDLAEDERRLGAVLLERRQDSKAFFGRVAGQWDDVRNELFGTRFGPAALLGLIPPNWTVADLGCGTGNAAELLAPCVARVIAVDQSPPMLKAAQKRLAAFTNIDFVEGDLTGLPLAAASVDAAVCLLVLHHLPDPAAALRQMARILRPGGTALVVDMVAHDRNTYRHTMGHRWLGFSESHLLPLFQAAGFRDIRYRLLPSDTQARGPDLFIATAAASEKGPAGGQK
jgi:ubiquinone/menaquinone biosynthesis C-methylase UbiE/DNA-binding transcriptional ArsR family regulator